MEIREQMKVTAQDATTVTLQPQAGLSTQGDSASGISQIVLTMGARDTVLFDVTNREWEVVLRRR